MAAVSLCRRATPPRIAGTAPPAQTGPMEHKSLPRKQAKTACLLGSELPGWNEYLQNGSFYWGEDRTGDRTIRARPATLGRDFRFGRIRPKWSSAQEPASLRSLRHEEDLPCDGGRACRAVRLLSGNAMAVGLLVTIGQIKDNTIQVRDIAPTALASLRGRQGPPGLMGFPGSEGPPGPAGTSFSTTEMRKICRAIGRTQKGNEPMLTLNRRLGYVDHARALIYTAPLASLGTRSTSADLPRINQGI